MKTKILILGALLVSATAFGQSKGKGKYQEHRHVQQVTQQEKNAHGKTVSEVAKTTRDGQTVSAVASSKNKGKHLGADKKQNKIKKAKAAKVKKNEPVQKRVRTNRPEVPAGSRGR